MRKISLQIIITAVVVIALYFVYRLAIGNVITIAVPNPGFDTQGKWISQPDSLISDYTNEGIVTLERVRTVGNRMDIRYRAVSSGESDVILYVEGEVDDYHRDYVAVDRFMNIHVNGMSFTGEEGILFGAGIFLLLTCIWFLLYYLGLSGGAIYSYQAIFAAGMVLFTGAGAIGLFIALIRFLLDPLGFGMYVAIQAISSISSMCMFLMTIPMLIFAVAMIISNIELLRHERVRFANVLGILIPVAMIAGEVLLYVLQSMDWMGSFEEYRIRTMIFEVLDTIYVYFECMLAGSIICGIRAVKHKVAFDRDYIIILGCKFRADGSLTPLLQGRCDRAVGFWKEQKEKTGKEAVIIPSGGQGADESMPEAEAMARYILTQGVPESAIIRETESKNTYQNMEFSKKIIDAAKTDAKVAYATTNYHVFRSGLWASLAGLEAEGLGGKTKWWFWPNAFMRECVGLMANRVPQEAVLLVIVIAVSVVLSYATIR